jgi:hypothetical protein
MYLNPDNHSKTALIVRFHDGTAKPNWGGRATSLAMSSLIFEMKVYNSLLTVNGDVIVNGFSKRPLDRLLDKLTYYTLQRLGITYPFWSKLEEIAELAITKSTSDEGLSCLVMTLERADSIWVNGEGDFIISNRYTLFRTLLIMHIAIKLGKEVSLVNSILSLPKGKAPISIVTESIHKVLTLTKSIIYRDPESLDLHFSLFPEIDARWCPDALFRWVNEGINLINNSGTWFGSNSEGLEPELQMILANPSVKLVGISGSSYLTGATKKGHCHLNELSDLIRALKRASFVPIIIGTDSLDLWMQTVAKSENCFFVSPSIPLATAMKLLSRLTCFISGRYHPSILASIVGTPCIFMESNSHKTRSLQIILGVQKPIEFPFFGSQPNISEIVEIASSYLDHNRLDYISMNAKISEKVKYID